MYVHTDISNRVADLCRRLDSQAQAFIMLEVNISLNQSASLSRKEILQVRYSERMCFEKYSHISTYNSTKLKNECYIPYVFHRDG